MEEQTESLTRRRALEIQFNPNRSFEWTYKNAKVKAIEQLKNEHPEMFKESK